MHLSAPDLDQLDEWEGDYLDLAISLATGCAGIAPTHIAPDNDDHDHDNGDDNVDDNNDNDDDDDVNDKPEVLSAARHAQHDQPGQTHARQPANDCFISCILLILLYHCLCLSSPDLSYLYPHHDQKGFK